MPPNGNGRPNSGTSARAQDVSGDNGDPGDNGVARFEDLHRRGSGRSATRPDHGTAVGVNGRLSIERQGAGRLARVRD